VPPTPLFSDLQPQEFERLIELLSPIRVPENTPICKEGEQALSMFVIAQGSVNVYFTDAAGKKVTLAKLVEGDFFGEFALFEGGTGDALFMIRTGTVAIWSGTGADAQLLAELPAGEIFGEIAVINLQPRTATVYAKTAVEVYRLDRENARRLLTANKELASKI